jgi:hypothetical protein
VVVEVAVGVEEQQKDDRNGLEERVEAVAVVGYNFVPLDATISSH